MIFRFECNFVEGNYAWNAFKITGIYLQCLRNVYKKQRKNSKIQRNDKNYSYKTGLDKACFQHDMAYGDFKDLAKRAASDKVLRNKAFNIAKNPKYDGYQRGLASMVYKVFDKKSSGSGVNIHANNEHSLDLAEEIHKPIIRKFKKRTVYSGFKDNIWGGDLADMQLISKCNDLDFYCVLLIFLVNMLELFL